MENNFDKESREMADIGDVIDETKDGIESFNVKIADRLFINCDKEIEAQILSRLVKIQNHLGILEKYEIVEVKKESEEQ